MSVQGKRAKISANNFKKVIRYFKKNGLKNTFYAAKERMVTKEHYTFLSVSFEELEEQKNRKWENPKKISIVVPAFETKEKHLKEMMDSVLQQSYPNLELVIGDAGSTDRVEKIVKQYQDERICYRRLTENAGISENTNACLSMATGDYIGLLDHDDVLTLDALYEVMNGIEKREKLGKPTIMVYSDEDKGDGELETYFEPHYKKDFNLDLFLSNNYMCHFSVIRSDVIKQLKFRKEYDGAQDFDLFLRVVDFAKADKESIVHIPKILYHWRCHSGSTSENPASKMYAYEAGRKTVLDFAKKQGWEVRVSHTEHLGFYRVQYGTDRRDIFSIRKDIGAVGGNVVRHGKIIGGAMNQNGAALYLGLSKNYSGYMHRAKLQQDVEALDIRNIEVREELFELFKETLKLFGIEEVSNRIEEEKILKASLEFSRQVREKGFLLLFDPE